MIAAALGLLRGVPLVAWVIVAAIAFGAVQRFQTNRAKAARAIAEQQRQVAEQKAEQARILARGTAAALEETDRRMTAQAKVNRDATTSTARSNAARAAGDRSAAGLRAAAADRAASSAAACHSTPGRDSEAKRLADVLVEVIDEYREVAAAADRAIIAGTACQQSYEALITPPTRQAP